MVVSPDIIFGIPIALLQHRVNHRQKCASPTSNYLVMDLKYEGKIPRGTQTGFTSDGWFVIVGVSLEDFKCLATRPEDIARLVRVSLVIAAITCQLPPLNAPDPRLWHS